MADAKRSPLVDRHVVPTSAEDIAIAGVRIPRSGSAKIEVDGHVIALTNLDRSFYPDAVFTKADLVAYYLGVADLLLPLARDRALTLGRFPGGVDGRGFAQSEVPGRPAWIERVTLELAKGGERDFTIANSRATLAWLAQMGTIELHSFLGLAHDLEHPTDVVFDLDPTAPAGLVEAAKVALWLRDRLSAAGIEARAKTSGSVGIHVLAPVAEPGAVTYAQTKAIAAALARELATAHPDLVTDRLEKSGREGRVLVDARQNSMRLTTVLPYSLRAAPRPTVSMPVTWKELEAAVRADDETRLVFLASDVLARHFNSG